MLCTFISANSQNLILNSEMNGAGNWNNGGCTPEMGDEASYGGPGGNNVTEIDFLTCIEQDVTIIAGSVFTINFAAYRRTTCDPFTPNPAQMRVIITGLPSNTVYSNTTYGYTNTTYAVTNETLVFNSNVTDGQVRVRVESFNNPEGCGVAVDNFTMIRNGPLPINLVSFNGAAKSGTVDLNWVTNNEVNSGNFIVYRSKNGVAYDEIGKVNATGFAAGSTYTLTDATPGAGANFYRIKLVDKSGSFKYSGVIRINLNAKTLDVAVYPTVVTNVLNYVVENPKAAKLRVMVSDVSGKTIAHSIEMLGVGTTQKSINVNNLASGVYLLTIADENNTFKKSITFKKN